MSADQDVSRHGTKQHTTLSWDALYLSEANAHSRVCGHFFMGWKADTAKPIKLNGAFFTLCEVLRFVVASATEVNSAHYFSIANSELFFDSPWKRWDIHNHLPLSIMTTPLRWVLQRTPSNTSKLDRWKLDSLELRIRRTG